MSKAGALRPFGFRDKLGYMLGNLGNDLTFTFASVYLLVFYTKVLGIASEAVGTLFLVARFLDAFTDITMGRLTDRLPAARGGRYRPWLLRASIPVAVTSALMYQSSLADAPMHIKIVYMVVTYILWGCVSYTAINIPYGSMASALSSAPDDRAGLSTVRSLGSLIANLLVGVGAAAVIYGTDAQGEQTVRAWAFPWIAAAFSALALVCYISCYLLTQERATPQVERGGKLRLGTLLGDRALVGIVLASVGVLAAQLLTQSINQYLFIDYFNNKNGVMLMSVVSMLPIILLAPAAAPLCRRFGKKELGVFGSLCGAASCLILFFLRTRSVGVYLAVSVLGYLGIGLFNLITWAYITDVIDGRELRYGKREDGTVYAVYSFARKVGQAIAGGLGGWTLGWIGFDQTQSVQSEAVGRGIYSIATLIPAVLYLVVALSLGLIYPLSKKRVEATTLALNKMKEQ